MTNPMFLPDYYTLRTTEHMPSGTYRCRVVLHEDCPVYEGHFPGNPIAPGVANIQMIKELAETILARPVTFAAIRQCKFLRPIRPDEHQPLDVMLTFNADQLSAEMLDGETTIMKIKAQIA